jgi:dUTP pyrophosphatase
LSSPHCTEVWTDNSSITFFKKPQDLSYQHARWAMTLSNYNISIHYKKGSEHNAADGLSRQHNISAAELDNKQVTLLPPKMFFDGPEEVKLRIQHGVELHVKQLHGNVKLPTKGSKEAAGYDLYAIEDNVIFARDKLLIPTGLSCKIPTGTYLRIAPRSGLANSSMIDIGAGVVDADYRGEIKILLFNLSNKPFEIKKGSKIAQFILEQIINPPIVEVQETSTSKYGKH